MEGSLKKLDQLDKACPKEVKPTIFQKERSSDMKAALKIYFVQLPSHIGKAMDVFAGRVRLDSDFATSHDRMIDSKKAYLEGP